MYLKVRKQNTASESLTEQKNGGQMYHYNACDGKLFATQSLIDFVDQNNRLVIIANGIDWDGLERKLSIYYSPDFGAPALPIRKMAGLTILKYIEGLSDEKLIERTTGDVFYQAFIGNASFSMKPPCDRSTLTVFRRRIGEEGCQVLLSESVRIHGKKAVNDVKEELIIDSTVQEKYTAFPNDAKLAVNCIKKIWAYGQRLNIKFRNKHKEEVTKLWKAACFDKSNSRNNNRIEILGKLRQIGLSLLDELHNHIPEKFMGREYYDDMRIDIIKALTQEKEDKNKIYSIYERQVYCISKGKPHKKYEFGSKVSIVIGSHNHIIYDAFSLDTNMHDSKTVYTALDNIYKRYGVKPNAIIGDLGYRGPKICQGTAIITPLKDISKLPKEDKDILIKRLNRRSDIEERISHLKLGHRLGRNELRHRIGDRINPILAAAASNFQLYGRKEQLRRERKQRAKSPLTPIVGKRSPRRFTAGVPFCLLPKPLEPNLFGNIV
jgi:IS5 family transposase